jgi:SAM-dependent methyltransferase
MKRFRVNNYPVYKRALEGKCGLEIGGPSRIFQNNDILPIYSIVARLDGCNFAEKTFWEGNIKEGLTYRYHKKRKEGYQFICDAVDLTGIASGSYDFIIASHVIEHIANPIKAIWEWLRVLEDTGILLLVVPHRDGTFDHNRPVTPLNHLIDDFKKNIKEDDLTHLPEILELHDLTLDPLAGDYESFKKRSGNNYDNRCLHHHVFNTKLVVEIFDYLGLQVLAVDTVLQYHIIAVAGKLPPDENANNNKFLNINVK